MPNILSPTAKFLGFFLGIIVISLSLSYLVLAWTEPTVAPPGGNVSTPLNISSTGQSKAGGLILNTGGATTGLIVQSGNVGIGTASPGAKLDIQGGDIKIGSSVTIKGDGSESTGLNSAKVGGYTAADLLAAGGGGSGWFTANTYFTGGGEPYFCSKRIVDATGLVTYSNINNGQFCSYNDLTLKCNGGYCSSGNASSFSFTDQTGVNVNTLVSSNPVTLTGTFTNMLAICNAGCTAIAKNGVWGGTTVSGFNPGDTIAIRQTSSGSNNTATTASVSIGSTTSGTWTVTTNFINAFNFTNQTGVSTSATISSNTVTLTGTFTNFSATCGGGCTDIAKNGVWGGTTVSGFNSSDTIAIRQVSSSNNNTVTTASVSIGPITSGTWTVTTGAAPSTTYTAPGSYTWVKPNGYGAGATVNIKCWAGGGGGAGGHACGCSFGGAAGGGGGGGGGGESTVALSSLGANTGVTIGGGGGGGSYGTCDTMISPQNGGNGGVSSFGSLTAFGGSGGLASTVCSSSGGTGGTSNFTTVWNGTNGIVPTGGVSSGPSGSAGNGGGGGGGGFGLSGATSGTAGTNGKCVIVITP